MILLIYLKKKIAYGKGYDPHGFIFSLPNGEPLRPHSITQIYRRHIQKLEIRYIHFHNIRVGMASILAYKGVSPKAIQKLLGHATLEMTLNKYAQMVDKEADEIAGLLDREFIQA